MKAYKIFEHDWSCYDMKYQVGNTYTCEEIELYRKGFHACKQLKDCLQRYPLMKWMRFAEVELQGKIDGDETIFVTDKIKIIKKLSFNEAISLILKELPNPDEMKIINRTDYAYFSNSVRNSQYIYHSESVQESTNIHNSVCIFGSQDITNSTAVRNSKDVNYSRRITSSNWINDSTSVNNSRRIKQSISINHSENVFNSISIFNSINISNSIGLLECANIDKSLFSYNIDNSLHLFNKPITEKRYKEIFEKIQEIFLNCFPETNNFNDLYEESGNTDWSYTPAHKAREATKIWQRIPQEITQYLETLPEFNQHIYDKITEI